MGPLYALILILDFGPNGLEVKEPVETYFSKALCEAGLEKFDDANGHVGVPEGVIRFGGACVELERVSPRATGERS